MSTAPAKVIRYAIYTRQSTDKGDEFSSCDVQFATCQAWAKATGGPHLHSIGQPFDDEGFSGATLNRPGLRRLRKVIDLGGIDRLYAVALDRLTRSMRDAVVLLNEFEKAGVELRLVNQPELTTEPEGRFLRHMLAAFAEFEREMIATRIAESRAYLRKHGRRLAGPPPFGYDADPIAGLWQAMGQPPQDDLLPAVIQSVRFLEHDSGVRTSLHPDVIDIVRTYSK